ncbi:MAG: hypothetical protein QW806_09950 [Nitrososphaerota archaeon]
MRGNDMWYIMEEGENLNHNKENADENGNNEIGNNEVHLDAEDISQKIMRLTIEELKKLGKEGTEIEKQVVECIFSPDINIQNLSDKSAVETVVNCVMKKNSIPEEKKKDVVQTVFHTFEKVGDNVSRAMDTFDKFTKPLEYVDKVFYRVGSYAQNYHHMKEVGSDLMGFGKGIFNAGKFIISLPFKSASFINSMIRKKGLMIINSQNQEVSKKVSGSIISSIALNAFSKTMQHHSPKLAKFFSFFNKAPILPFKTVINYFRKNPKTIAKLFEQYVRNPKVRKLIEESNRKLKIYTRIYMYL